MALRWGIIGSGWIAGLFARDLALLDGHETVAIGSRTQAAADRFGDEFGVAHRHASYEALVADPDVDVVYVATPHPMHHHDALLALGAGKHVLVEKAFTMTAAEAREVVEAARAADLFCMEAMWTRWLPHVVAIRDVLASGELGEIVLVQADHGQWFAPDPSHRLFAPELGGGALHDLGVYPVSFASMVLGTPSQVSALVTPAMTGVDGTTSMVLGYDSGAQALLSCTSAARSATTAAIVGTAGRIDVEGPFYAPAAFTVTPREGEPRRVDLPAVGRGMGYQAQEVADCLAAGRRESEVLPLDETVAIMETLERVLSAGGGGRQA